MKSKNLSTATYRFSIAPLDTKTFLPEHYYLQLSNCKMQLYND
jgi:hypothetical protein